MSGRDWQAFDAELRARAQELAVELLGKPSERAGLEWRWGTKGSLSVVIVGPKAGMWFDHEAGIGGGLIDLVGRLRGLNRQEALHWIGDRIGVAGDFGMHPRIAKRATRPAVDSLISPRGASVAAEPVSAVSSAPEPDAATPAAKAATRAVRIWATAHSAPEGHPYLAAKQVRPLALRADARGHLIVPLQDADGHLHSLETIAPDGAKRFLAGGAKRGHFCVIGVEPAPLVGPTGPILICEGWATGASLHMATGHTVIAAMDAGNLLPVAEALRARFPDADLVLIADNDTKPDRDTNPGVEAARKAVLAVDARIAVPAAPGDANDLFCAAGPVAVAALVAGAAKIPPPPPTYPAPFLTPDQARATLADAISRFMAAVPAYWTAVEVAREAAQDAAGRRGGPQSSNRNPVGVHPLSHCFTVPFWPKMYTGGRSAAYR
jgi:putative DNA primase/helicase